jgi:glycosyltransferase involved in cell wall biosynthesis
MQVDHARTIKRQLPGTSLAILHATQPTEEGVARAVLDLVADQVARGWRVVVASPPNAGFVAEVEARGAEHRAWPAGRAPGPVSAAEAVRLARILRGVAPDVLHLHSSKAGLTGRLAARGRLTTVFQPHAWSFEAAGGVQRRTAVAWERFAVRWTDATVCVSEGERRRGVEAGVQGVFRVIANGVDLERFPEASADDRAAARRRLELPDGPLVLCVGRLARQKGQDILFEAWALVLDRVPGARLALVGDGPARDSLRRAAPPSVHFAGLRFDVVDWLAAADVVAAPSRWEGMSLALLEAMASGRSVVASDTPGALEALGGEAGAVVPIGDVAALGDALAERLLDPARAAAEGRAGRSRAERHHDVRRSTAAAAELYETLLRRP